MERRAFRWSRKMNSPNPEEKRGSPRHRLGHLAIIQLVADTPQHFCLVTDFSDQGVRLHVKGFHVPDRFDLLLSADGPAHSGSYKVVWRDGENIGATFVGPPISNQSE